MKEIKHGLSAYRNHYCRCDICRGAGTLDAKKRRDAERVEREPNSPERPVEFSYELKAKFPVKAKTPKATAYQYYEPEIRAEAQPVEIEVAKIASLD